MFQWKCNLTMLFGLRIRPVWTKGANEDLEFEVVNVVRTMRRCPTWGEIGENILVINLHNIDVPAGDVDDSAVRTRVHK